MAFSLLNVLGLSIGMASCLLILQYVVFERSYDAFHDKGDRIYRVSVYKPRVDERSATTSVPLGPALKADFPEVQAFVRVTKAYGPTITYGNGATYRAFNEDKVYFADSSFLSLFSFPLLKGNAAAALAGPNAVVLTESAARQYFGEEEPLGKTITVHEGNFGKLLCTVRGVMADVPENSHLKFKVLVSFETILQNENGLFWANGTNWSWSSFYTYVLLAPGTDPQRLANKLPGLVRKYQKDDVEDVYALQPLRRIHLYSNLTSEAEVNGDSNIVYFITLVAFFILVIAWVNYINLSTARAINRAREVGVRKAAGASRGQLIYQFVFETVLLNILALGLTGLLLWSAEQVYGVLEQLTGVAAAGRLWDDPLYFTLFLLTFAVGALLSGIYPALILSAFNPVQVLKSKVTGSGKVSLRKGLTVFQFTASIALLTGTLAVYNQLGYMRNKNLGMNIERLLIVKGPAILGEGTANQARLFRERMRAYPQVAGITSSQSIPGKDFNIKFGNQIRRFRQPMVGKANFFATTVDYNFLDTYGIKLIAGRNFSPQFGTDANYQTVIINEVAARTLGFENPASAVGEKILNNYRQAEIIGVIQNYHHRSLKQSIDALLFFVGEPDAYFTLRVKAGPEPARALSSLVQQAEAQYKEMFPGNPFEYFFLDAFFNEQYKADQNFGRVFRVFSLLAILVACLGLYGLASFIAVQRTKEIGVRKVLGASVAQILLLLAKDFVKLILIATVIAWPLAYFGIRRWMETYPFRTPLEWWLFVLPGGLVLLVALFSVSYQTIKAASTDPVRSLRYE